MVVAELAHGGEGCIQVDQVVVAELLALQLAGTAPARFWLAVPGGALVRVFAVAQALAGRQAQLQRGRVGILGGHPAADRRVVGRRVGKGRQGQLAPQGRGDAGRTRGRQQLQKGRVLAGAGQHRHVGVVLGRRPHHRRAADVDVLDCGLPADRRIGDRRFKRIQVDHDHIDRVDALGRQVSLVGGVGAPGQDAAVNARVQGLDPAAQDLGSAGVFSHLGDRHPRGLQGGGGATARNQPVAGGHQPLGQGHQPLFVGDT